MAAESTKTSLRYEEIAQHLRREIQHGALLPGDRLPSLRAMRAQHGITQITVEKAQALLEEEGLIVRSARSGVYVAQPHQRRLTGIIGFQGIGFSQTEFSPYWISLINGVEAALRERDAQILLLSHLSPAGWSKVDGILMNGGEGEVSTHLIPPHVPAVSFITPPHFSGKAADCKRAAAGAFVVAPDDYEGMRAATQHLIELGHHRIGYLHNGRCDLHVYPRRLAGFRMALREAGIEMDERWSRPLPTPSPRLHFRNAARDEMRRWLADGWKKLGCTALLVLNDDAAWGAIEALQEKGYSVPDDVSVVGYDGTDLAELDGRSLTTVDIRLEDIGRMGVNLLWRCFQGENISQRSVVMPATLRVGDSTAAIKKR